MILTAYKGRDGTVTIPIQHDRSGGNNFVDLSLVNARVEFDAITSAIDSDGPNVEINGNEVTLTLGALDLKTGAYDNCQLIIYNETYTDGKVIAGPGKEIVILNFYE